MWLVAQQMEASNLFLLGFGALLLLVARELPNLVPERFDLLGNQERKTLAVLDVVTARSEVFSRVLLVLHLNSPTEFLGGAHLELVLATEIIGHPQHLLRCSFECNELCFLGMQKLTCMRKSQ